jgi:hypothetical protein
MLRGTTTRSAGNQTETGLDAMYDEQHFKPDELAELWGVSGDTIRRLFRDVPGVLVIDRPEKMHKRSYSTMRIPESVARRVYERLSKGKRY